MKKLKKLLMISIIAVFIVITVFFYNMYNYYHPKLLYVIQDNLDEFYTVKDKIFKYQGIGNILKSLEISEFKIDDKTYTLEHIFPSHRFSDASDKILTFEYFSKNGNVESVSDSYGIVYSPDESTLKKGLTHTWWNTIEYDYVSIDEHWYLVRRSYTDLIQSMLGI